MPVTWHPPHSIGIFLNDPIDFDKPNADELYIDRIRKLSAENRLSFEKSGENIRETMQRMSLDDYKLPDFTPVAALAYAVYEMDTTKPWLHPISAFSMEDGHDGDLALNLDD